MAYGGERGDDEQADADRGAAKQQISPTPKSAA